MKKINVAFLMLLFGALVFTFSCGDDDDEGGTPFEGTTWEMVSDSYTGCDNPGNDGTDTFNCPTECVTLTFSGGTVTWVETSGGSSNTETATYTLSGNTVTIMEPGGTMTFTYSIVGNTLTLVGDGGDPGCTETVILTAA